MLAIDIKNLSFSYDDRKVLQDLNLTVADGDRVWLSAESGFGKTTLLRLISGLEQPDAGDIRTDGARISTVFQEDRLLPWYTVAQNIELVVSRELSKEERTRRVDLCLDAVGLAEEKNTYPDELSGGMSRRVALARALVSEFDVLLLDEPFTGIDVDNRDKIARFINEKCSGKTLILVTHDACEAELLSAEKIDLAAL